MVSINAFASSSGLVCKKSRESSGRNGVPFFQYNGLRAADTLQMRLNKLEAKEFTSTSGNFDYIFIVLMRVFAGLSIFMEFFKLPLPK